MEQFISHLKADQCDATAARLAETYGGERVDSADLSTMEASPLLPAPSLRAKRRLTSSSTTLACRGVLQLKSSPKKGGTRCSTPTSECSFSPATAPSQAASEDDPSRVVNIGSIDGFEHRSRHTRIGCRKRQFTPLRNGDQTREAQHHLNAIAPGPFPTWMLSTGVGSGGDVENTDWDGGHTEPSTPVQQKTLLG